MPSQGLWIYAEAAQIFGVLPTTVSQIASALGIIPKKVPHSSAKGLDADDMALIASTLRKAWSPPAQLANAV